ILFRPAPKPCVHHVNGVVAVECQHIACFILHLRVAMPCEIADTVALGPQVVVFRIAFGLLWHGALDLSGGGRSCGGQHESERKPRGVPRHGFSSLSVGSWDGGIMVGSGAQSSAEGVVVDFQRGPAASCDCYIVSPLTAWCNMIRRTAHGGFVLMGA